MEFLQIQPDTHVYESDLEQGLIDHLQQFLLELGRGFSFVARQKRFTLDGRNFFIDLVFYNYILKCFVLIDLKTGDLTHQDIGQMQIYVILHSGADERGGQSAHRPAPLRGKERRHRQIYAPRGQ